MLSKKIVGYARVSTLEQKKNGFGMDIQIREIERFAKENNLKIDRIFKDEAISGLEEKREELDLLMEECSKKLIKAVIFPSTDRTARSVRLSENLYYELSKDNVRLYFTDMPFYDHDNHGDVMVRQMKEVIAEGNRNEIVNRLRKGREERIRKGKTPGGTVPYGYIRESKEFKIALDEAKVIKTIFKKSEVYNSNKIAEIINKKGYKRRNGGEWTQRQVWAILHRQELYKEGIIKYGGVTGTNKKLIIIKDN